MRGLKKGQTNNPNGRPKGTPNKVTSDLRDCVKVFVDKNMKNMQVEFDKLEGKDKLLFLEKMMQYVLPKQQAMQIDATVEDRLTDAQVNQLFEKIMNGNDSGR